MHKKFLLLLLLSMSVICSAKRKQKAKNLFPSAISRFPRQLRLLRSSVLDSFLLGKIPFWLKFLDFTVKKVTAI